MARWGLDISTQGSSIQPAVVVPTAWLVILLALEGGMCIPHGTESCVRVRIVIIVTSSSDEEEGRATGCRHDVSAYKA